MILVAALEVALAKSPASRSTVRIPRSCASSAQAEPVAPPPITHRSNCWPEMFVSSSTLLFTSAPGSKCDLGPEPQNWGVRQRGIATYVCVILKCGLHQPVGPDLQRIVQLECFFRTERRATQQRSEVSERIADLAVHETNAYAVLRTARKGSIDAGSGRDLNVFAAYIARAVVKANRCIQPAVRTGVRTVQSLARHSIDQIVAAALDAGGIRKTAAVVHTARPVFNGGRSTPQITGFGQKVRRIANCEVGPGRILLVGIPVASRDGALHVEVTHWRDENLRSRRTCRIERLEDGTEQIAERIAEGLDEPSTSVFLIAIKIQT